MHSVRFEDNDYVFTQMEAMYARRAFPLFDEPSFKIPYQLTISAHRRADGCCEHAGGRQRREGRLATR